MTMKLEYLELCGFRGFKRPLRIEFGSAFTIICGRNGVGKSTVFDAIEYCLTGAIEKYLFGKADKESISDYIWWRGGGHPDEHYVRVGFVRDDGERYQIWRMRDGSASHTPSDIEAILCTNGQPASALRQLFKTSIIRDEWIAALSVDMGEVERFELVRSALGPAEGAGLSVRAKEVANAATNHRDELATLYESIRDQLSSRLAQLAELQDAVTKAGDVGEALEVIQSSLSRDVVNIMSSLSQVRAELTERKAKLDSQWEAVRQGKEIELLKRDIRSDTAVAVREAALHDLARAQSEYAQAANAVTSAKNAYELEEKANSTAAQLLALVEAGEKLGLHNEQCPLCAAERSHDQFHKGLQAARERAASLSASVEKSRASLADVETVLDEALLSLENARQRWVPFERQDQQLGFMESAHVEYMLGAGLDLQFADEPDLMEVQCQRERDRLIDLERAVRTLEASQSVSLIADLQGRIESLRREAESVNGQLGKAQVALTDAHTIERTVKRVSAEIVDERLAQLSPLLNELYQRLQPHADWRTIQYSIRGDVRRFLSLKVGDGLNPQFVFSSGQRRAAGLAFLLSVHLSRSWTSWRTLLLDDPVQHIDDFRALQLAEILASLRQDGRQIVCAVEDAALAELLCRRLSTDVGMAGRRYDLDNLSQGFAGIVADRMVPPLRKGILRPVNQPRTASDERLPKTPN